MNIFESTFEKHKQLVLEKMSQADLKSAGLVQDKGTLRKMDKVAQKKSSVGKDPNAKSIDDFSPNQFWHDFKEMPVSQFITQYGSVFNDPKIKDFLTAGGDDGDKKEMFTVTHGTLPVSSLVPSQNEIGFSNSLDDLCKTTFDINRQLQELKKILKGSAVALAAPGAPDGVPIIVFSKKYIIDGHHRWSKLCCGNKDATADVLNFETVGSSMSVEQVLKAFHLAIASRIGKIPVSSKSGANLIGASTEQVKSHVKKSLDPKNPDTQKFITIYKTFKNLKDAEQISNYIANNASIVAGASPATNTPRSGMPQTDEAPGYADALKKGDINFAADSKTKNAVAENFISESTFNKFKNLYTK
jgi:hypothetical protein